ncbi:MAG: isoleucine--tRNA ligase [Candidatus Nanoarchaeia archaeon]|nr:isoleucine--tRNA ligase [Candidatus Nanoarchaeia archaeon]
MFSFNEIEKEVKAFWKKIKLSEKVMSKNKGKKSFFLLDGPPYANYIPHVGHIRNTVYKDLHVKLAFMQGYDVLFQPGFDTHGLPIENMVEKKLNFKSKQEIVKYGVDKFNKECRENATTNMKLWMEVYDNLGSWYVWKDPYFTYNNSYLESAWWTFKQMFDKGMVYEGKRPVFWCPSCQTALAGYETTDSYKMMTDPSIYIKFKVKGKNEFLLVFTTTPWTLISNVAVAAHPNEDYVKVETAKGVLILAKARLELLEKLELGFKILEEFKGKKLDGLEYESVIDVPTQKELEKNSKAHRVYMSIPILKERVASKMAIKKGTKGGDVFEDFVNVADGTGLVHIAPGHGKTDNEVGNHYNLPSPSPLDDECKYTDDAGEFKGVFVKKADDDIIETLDRTGNLLHHEKISHSYPVCWRCKAPLIFRLSNQWFFKVDMIKDKMLKYNEEVNWYPEFARERFANWVANADDWNFSRQRYWGIPIPLWKCECGQLNVMGSLKDLQKHATKEVKDNFDLHNASKVQVKCSECKKPADRINEIFDVWFDSGIAPWASLGYPFENKKLFDEHYPVSRINESQDQIRGWFYSLMFTGVAVQNKQPYETVSMPGWVLDSKGEKMSKSLGNVVTAKACLETYGADSTRLYYMMDTAPYETQKFNVDTIKKEVWSVLNIFWNLHNYLLDQTDKIKKVTLKEVEDKWLISRLNSMMKNYQDNVEKFEYHVGTRELTRFITNNLSREYIQWIRERADNGDEAVSYVMFETISICLKLLAPICPYVTEKIYQNIKDFGLKKDSVHLEDWPKSDNKLIDEKLESNFEIVKEVIQGILAEREKIKQGIRWPLASAEISLKEPNSIKDLVEIIKRQTNVKEIKVKKGDFFVKLDEKSTPELEQEGYAREVMRKVQALRKNAGLKKEDRIVLAIASKVDLSKFELDIKNKVGAESLTFDINGKYKHSSKEKIRDYEFEISFNVK